jgi:hypothetical protein
MPSKASRMINSDHLSPTMSTARATGHPGLVHVFAVTGDSPLTDRLRIKTTLA